jgi:hypothetical protein
MEVVLSCLRRPGSDYQDPPPPPPKPPPLDPPPPNPLPPDFLGVEDRELFIAPRLLPRSETNMFGENEFL